MESHLLNANAQSPEAATNDESSIWMRRGIALLNTNGPDNLREAIQYFDRAIAFRRMRHPAENAWPLYGLIAGWLNRGDAFARLGTPDDLAEALHSYDKALELLRELPLDAHPLFRRRQAIAWINRGVTLLAQGNEAAATEAVRSFGEAIATLEVKPAIQISDRNHLLAGAWMNQGNAWLRTNNPGAWIKAQNAARKSLALIGDAEQQILETAEIGFKARHVLCRAIAELLEENPDGLDAEQLVAEATDAVDEAMRLARHWELQNLRSFNPLIVELFRFGARIYQSRQPHFLTEFLLESLDPARSPGAPFDDARMHATAVEALWLAFREMQRNGFKALNTARFETLLAQLKELRVTEERLGQLRWQSGELGRPP